MYKLLEKEVSGPFCIPPGIVTTNVPVLERIATEIPELGIMYPKSTSLLAHKGHDDPTIARTGKHSAVNAVGLTNIGIEQTIGQLAKARIPENKALVISVFGRTEQEFSEVAERAAPSADAVELNFFCPNDYELRQLFCNDAKAVGRIVKNVADKGIDVFVKMPPWEKIEDIVLECLRGGAKGFSAVNTAGPKWYCQNDHTILSNKVGGSSGKPLLKVGIRTVKKIRSMTELPIIAYGGITCAEDVMRYRDAGADFQGVGTGLAGMSTQRMKDFFHHLLIDCKNSTNYASEFLVDMREYETVKVIVNEQLADDLNLLGFDKAYSAMPGQFVFAGLPGMADKPFSVMDDDPLTLLIQKRGKCTAALTSVRAGDMVEIRGPYGNTPEVDGKILLVGGGTGIAALYLFAKRNPETYAVLGAKDEQHLAYSTEFMKNCSEVWLTTQNGEIGIRGIVTDPLERVIEEAQPDYILNCGPEPMIRKSVLIELNCLPRERWNRVLSSIEHDTGCGEGLCGRCYTKLGERSCVDGTFFSPEML
ncbi:MAG: hypothetical protein V1837_06535 [Candidatus Woesearchaeota archaeon]